MKRVKIEENNLLYRAYRNSPTLFPTPYGLLFPKIGGSQPRTKTTIAVISGTLWTSNLAGTFLGSIRTKAHETFWRKGIVSISRDCTIFLGYPYYLRNR